MTNTQTSDPRTDVIARAAADLGYVPVKPAAQTDRGFLITLAAALDIGLSDSDFDRVGRYPADSIDGMPMWQWLDAMTMP